MNRLVSLASAWPVVGVLILAPLLLGMWEHASWPAAKVVSAPVDPIGPGNVPASVLDSVLREARPTAPFRTARMASIVAYDPLRADPALQVAPPPRERPTLAVTGIVSGVRSAAVIEGVPGRQGATLMQVGDTAAGLRVRRISADQVVITGFDTTWTLSVRRPW